MDEIWDLIESVSESFFFFLRVFLPTLPVPGRPVYLDNSTALIVVAVRSCLNILFSHLPFLTSISLSLEDGPI